MFREIDIRGQRIKRRPYRNWSSVPQLLVACCKRIDEIEDLDRIKSMNLNFKKAHRKAGRKLRS